MTTLHIALNGPSGTHWWTPKPGSAVERNEARPPRPRDRQDHPVARWNDPEALGNRSDARPNHTAVEGNPQVRQREKPPEARPKWLRRNRNGAPVTIFVDTVPADAPRRVACCPAHGVFVSIYHNGRRTPGPLGPFPRRTPSTSTAIGRYPVVTRKHPRQRLTRTATEPVQPSQPSRAAMVATQPTHPHPPPTQVAPDAQGLCSRTSSPLNTAEATLLDHPRPLSVVRRGRPYWLSARPHGRLDGPESSVPRSRPVGPDTTPAPRSAQDRGPDHDPSDRQPPQCEGAVAAHHTPRRNLLRRTLSRVFGRRSKRSDSRAPTCRTCKDEWPCRPLIEALHQREGGIHLAGIPRT